MARGVRSRPRSLSLPLPGLGSPSSGEERFYPHAEGVEFF
jgi:hypothetical protein